jgi:REP element-mobilizing transposase RayT
MRVGLLRPTLGEMPRRLPLDPHGWYHVGTRGCYGRTLFHDAVEYELFLDRYGRVAKKYGWDTVDWVQMRNHHHFVVRLNDGGLSEGMRELHGWYSRTVHSRHGLTGQGHLVRHAFFARLITSESDALATCRYVSLNYARATGEPPHATPWGGYPAIIGLRHPRPFHTPSILLGLISTSPPAAQRTYRAFVLSGLDQDRQVPSPNDGVNSST